MNRILIADDKTDNRCLLSTLLQEHGYEVDTARNGAEALEMARQSPPLLIVSDLLMPVMDGFTLLREWREDEHLKQIPFVVYTATYTDPQDEQLARDFGADAFIIKPAEPETFIRQIRGIIATVTRPPVVPTASPGTSTRPPIVAPEKDEAGFLRQYNSLLIDKLEHKLEQLEKTRRAQQQDLSRRKQAEEAARESQALYHSLVEHLPAGVFRKDAQGRFVFVNAAFCQLKGMPPERFLGKTALKLGLEDAAFAATGASHHAQIMETGRRIEVEEKHLRDDGKVLYFHVVKSPVYDADKKITGSQGILFDITARKQAEAALAREGNLLRAMFDLLPDFIYLKDEQSRFVMLNNRFSHDQSTPVAAEELVGRTDADFYPPEMASQFRADELAVLSGEPLIDQEEVFILPDGSRQVILTTKLPFHDISGKIVGLVGYGRDISERKRAEEHIRRLNRTYMVLSAINQLIVRERDSQILISEVCHIAVAKGGFLMAWIGLLDATGRHTNIAAQAGASLEVLKKLDDIVNQVQPGVVCAFTQHTLATGEHAVCNDIGNDPQAVAWRKQALERGCRAMVSLPITAGNRVVGNFNLYAAEPGIFDDYEMRLLDELATDISFALEINRRDQDRQKTEAELRWRTAFFEAQVDSALDGILVVDNQGQKILQNQKLVELLNIPPHIAQNPDNTAQLEFLAGRVKSPGPYAAKIARLQAHPDEVSRDEIEFIDGTILSRISAPVRDKTGHHYGRIWTYRDITERKRVEESHARLAKAVEQSAETIVITDLQGKILYVNPAFEKTTGYTCTEAIGQNPRLIKSGKQDAEYYRRMWEVLGHGEIWSGHFINRRKDGTLFEEDATISPVRDAAGNVINYVAVKRDVTREMQLEEQFRQSQKMEAIGQLAGGVAHDFNNILAVIMMQTELTGMSENLSAGVSDGLRQIRAAAERAANLTRQLLLFSRKQVMQQRDLDLNEIVTSLTKMLQRILGEDVNLQLNLCPRALRTHVDAGMLDQVLLNLVVNARDAMPGGGKLVIETSERIFTGAEAALIPDARAGHHVCLRVTDTGCGMSPEIMARIFEPFFTTKDPGKGTGLGLATVFGIVKQHGGMIEVESQAGQGATFRIYLRADVAAGRSRADEPVKPQLSRGTETVLLVEDEAGVRQLTRIVLERQGYQVVEAINGVEALKIWQQQHGKFHLLLTDIVMPEGVSGRELATRLQAEDPKLRVIFTSGYSADIAGREIALEVGQNFISKPATPQQLLETVRRCLDK